MNPIQQARNAYRVWTNDLLREAIASRTVHLALGLATIGSAALLGKAIAADRVRPPLVFVTAAAAVAAGGATWVKGLDADQDWEAWEALNKGDRRADFLASLAKTQADGLTQLSTYWLDYQKAQHQQTLKGWHPQDSAPVAVQPAIAPVAIPQPQPQDIARDLAVTLKSAIIVGQPGSGKGLTVAHATRHIKAQHPDVTIWVVDPKADPSERAYWAACDRVLDSALPAFANESEVERFQVAVDQFIEQFKALPGRKLLIFDEALAVKELMPKWFRGCMAGFNHLCSTGRSKGVYGWLLSQTPNAADFGISGGARNVYRRVLLVSADDLGLIYNRSTFFTSFPDEALLGVTGRVFFDSLGNRWGVVPRYPLFEGPVIDSPSRHDQLERLYEAPPAIAPHEQFYQGKPDINPARELSAEESAILAYVQRVNGATVRRIQQAKLPQLQGLDSNAVRALCDGLAANGLGRWEDGEFLST